MKHLKPVTILFSILVIAMATFAYRINRPLVYLHDWNGAHYGIFARNHLLMGYHHTKLAQVYVVDPPQERHITYSTDFHHPVLYPILLSPFLAIFGHTSELALRLPSVIASVLSVYFLYKIGKQYWGTSGGITAGLLPIATPMMRYFGSLPAQDPLILAALLGQLSSYLQWLESEKKHQYRQIWLWGIFACLLGWPGYYLTGYIILHFLLVKRKMSFPVAALITLPLISFSAHLLHTKLITGQWLGGGLGKSLFFRLSWRQDDHGSFSYSDYIIRSLQWWQVYFTRVFLITSSFGGFTLIKPLLKRTLNKQQALLLILGFLGLTHPLIFRNAAFRHEYMWLYLIPFLSLSSASLIHLLSTKVYNSKLVPNVKKLSLPLILITIFGLIWMERNLFVQTLFTNKLHQPGYELGQLVRQQTQPGDKILVTNGEFHSFFGRYALFYGQREITSRLPNLDELNQYRLVVIPTTHTLPSPQTIESFDTSFQRKQNNTFIWYDTTVSRQ